MKKYLIILIILLTLSACSTKEEIKNNVKIVKEEEIKEEKEIYIDNNPIKVGLYSNGKLITTYKNKFKNDKDIANFDIYFTNEEDVYSNNTKYNFNKYKEQYENIDNYKIGFYIEFEDNEKKYEKIILDPDVEFALSPYIYIYLYDDIHQPDGAWYSHITKDDYNDDTVFSSIKLYMAEYCEKITTPITLTVFTYDDFDDFNEDGYYRGNSYHTVTIINE